MIRSFKCSDTEALARGDRVRRFVNISKVARRKLRQLEIAGRLDDVKVPPDNRLEALKGRRSGQFSIRINDQWQLCFRWTRPLPVDQVHRSLEFRHDDGPDEEVFMRKSKNSGNNQAKAPHPRRPIGRRRHTPLAHRCFSCSRHPDRFASSPHRGSTGSTHSTRPRPRVR